MYISPTKIPLSPRLRDANVYTCDRKTETVGYFVRDMLANTDYYAINHSPIDCDQMNMGRCWGSGGDHDPSVRGARGVADI